jgi:hypothetical protein
MYWRDSALLYVLIICQIWIWLATLSVERNLPSFKRWYFLHVHVKIGIMTIWMNCVWVFLWPNKTHINVHTNVGTTHTYIHVHTRTHTCNHNHTHTGLSICMLAETPLYVLYSALLCPPYLWMHSSSQFMWCSFNLYEYCVHLGSSGIICDLGSCREAIGLLYPIDIVLKTNEHNCRYGK